MRTGSTCTALHVTFFAFQVHSILSYSHSSVYTPLGSAVAVEHIFSSSRDTISTCRASLRPETICTLMVLKHHICYNPLTNFSFLPSSGPPSTQPAVPPPQPISTAPAPAPLAQPAPLAFNPFHTSYVPLYHVTDFYKHPQGYAQLQQPMGSPHRQCLPPSPDPDAEMSSPTHASSSVDHYSLLQPPSPRDVPMGTPPSDHLPFRDIEPINYMSYGETLQWLHNTADAPAAKGEGPYSDSYYAAYPPTPPPPDLEQPAAQRCRLSSWRYKVALPTRNSMSPPDGGGATIQSPQPALGPLTASQSSEGPASPEEIPTDNAAPPGGHHIPSSGENPTSLAKAAEPAIPGGF